jgi:glycosyltransferase involved in cell wall biosynthesis
MKKIKIALIHPHFRFWMGGSRFVFELAKEIKANKKFNQLYEPLVIVNQGNQKFIEQFENVGIKIYQINKLACTNDIWYWIFFPFWLIFEIIKTIQIIKKEKVEKLIAFLFPPNLTSFIISKIMKVDYYFYCYEPFPFFHNKKYIREQKFPKDLIYKTLSFLYGWLDVLAVKKAKKIFTLNKVTKAMTKKVYKKDSIVTWMGVNTDFFKHVSENQNYYLKKYPYRLIISHSTDYTTAKKTDLAIKTINLLIKKYKKIFLLITSTQPNNPNKKKYLDLVDKLKLKNNVVFLDLIDLKLLPHLYSASIAYLSTSYDKMMGTSSSNLPVKEAMSCETPVLRANITDEDVIDGETGFLIKPQDIKNTAKKIEYLIKNPTKRKAMGKKAREFIKKRFNWYNVTDNIIKNL